MFRGPAIPPNTKHILKGNIMNKYYPRRPSYPIEMTAIAPDVGSDTDADPGTSSEEEEEGHD